MAREQRKDVDYFPHKCNHSAELHIIETKYGNDGYCAYYRLLEELGKAKNHYINIGDELKFMHLVSVFKIDEDKATDMLNYMARLKVIDKQFYEEYGVIWCEDFTNDLEDAYRKRINKLYKRVDVLLEISGQSPAETPQSPADWNEKQQKTTQSAESIHKGKERIVKDSKGKESREEDQSKNQRFSPPTQIDVEEYFSSKINETFWSDAECQKEAKKFVDFYTSKNWYVGKNKMKIWKSAASGWINRKEEFESNKTGRSDHQKKSGVDAALEFGNVKMRDDENGN